MRESTCESVQTPQPGGGGGPGDVEFAPFGKQAQHDR